MEGTFKCPNISLYDSKSKVWSGEKIPFPYKSDVSAGAVFLKALLDRPSVVAEIYCHNGKQYTNLEIAEKMVSVSLHFNRLGLQQGDVIGISAMNTDFITPLVYGAFLNGIVVSAMDPHYEKPAIERMCSITQPKIIFCQKFNYQRIAECLEKLGFKIPIYTIDEPMENVSHISEFLQDQVDPKQTEPVPLKVSNQKHPAITLCSSGTTGPSKAIVLTHAGLLSVKVGNLFKENDITFVSSSIYWTLAVASLVCGPIYGITRVLTNQLFSPEHFLDILEQQKVQSTFATIAQIAQLVASPTIHYRNLENLRYFICAGSYISMTLLTKLQKFMPRTFIVICYGMTEVPRFFVSGGLAKENGNNGRLNPNVELRIINDDGYNLGYNEEGEILVRTLAPFVGYYGDKAATDKFCDNEGWMHTGDVGCMNDDGELKVISRKKEMLRNKDYKYSPSEIENIILEIPEILETCVCGIETECLDEEPAAMIVLKKGATLTKQEIYQYVAERLEKCKHLDGGIYFVENIPKTPSGKHKRNEVVKIIKTLIL